MRFLYLLFCLAASSASAVEWGDIVTTSPSKPLEANHLCFSDANNYVECSERGIGVDASGNVSVSGVITFPAVTGAAGVSQTAEGSAAFVGTATEDLDMDSHAILNISQSIFVPVTGAEGVSQSIVGDNMGTHTATEDIDMDGNAITNGGASDMASIQLTDDTEPTCSTSADVGKIYYSESLQRLRMCR